MQCNQERHAAPGSTPALGVFIGTLGMGDFTVSGWGASWGLHLGVRGANGSALLLLGQKAAEAGSVQSRSVPCSHQPPCTGPPLLVLATLGRAQSPQSPGKARAESALMLPAAVGAAALHRQDFFVQQCHEAHSSSLTVGLRKVCKESSSPRSP